MCFLIMKRTALGLCYESSERARYGLRFGALGLMHVRFDFEGLYSNDHDDTNFLTKIYVVH